MKKPITFFAISVFAVFTVFGTTWTVSNNPEIPAQFTQISEAITSGQLLPGDTLLVAGSPSRYSNFAVHDSLVIIGAGINNPYGSNTRVEQVGISTDAGFNPSGSRISGLVIESYFYWNNTAAGGGSQVIENVIIERCMFWHDVNFDYNTSGSAVFRNNTIRNCVFKNQDINFSLGNYDSIVIHNCLLDNRRIARTYSSDLSTVYVLNNVFINETSNVFNAITNMIIENNIFMKALPQGCVDCVFNSNTSYGSANNTLNGGNNYGDNNNDEENPLFNNYTISDGEFTFSSGYDFSLQLTPTQSPCVGTGVGDTDRGMYGGPMPVLVGTNPSIPQMTEVSFSDNASSVKEEGTLNVKFKAKKQD